MKTLTIKLLLFFNYIGVILVMGEAILLRSPIPVRLLVPLCLATPVAGGYCLYCRVLPSWKPDPVPVLRAYWLRTAGIWSLSPILQMPGNNGFCFSAL